MKENAEIIAEGINFPESPVFDKNGNLWFTELKSGNIVRLAEGEIIRYHIGSAANGIAFDNKGLIWATDSEEHRVKTFNPTTNEIKVVLKEINGEHLNRPNDLAFDNSGNLIISCHADGRSEPLGYLLAIDNTGNPKIISKGKYFTNGIVFIHNDTQIIFAETYGQKLWIGDWDAQSAIIRNERPWLDVGGPVGPDGLTTDNKDNVYVAMFGQGKILKVNSLGKIVKDYHVPGNRPTCCAFRFTKYSHLYVTEAEFGRVLKLKL